MPTETVLIIDDDANQRRKLSLCLSQLEYSVVDAADAALALQKADLVKIDAVISKAVMPVISGFKLCRTLRKDDRFAEIPLILFTNGQVEKAAETEAHKAGANKIVTREADLAEIVEALRDALAVSNSTASVLASLRDDFLAEAGQQTRHFIAEFESNLDVGALAKWTHRSGGSGGMIGFPQIGHAAAEIEALLKDPAGWDRHKVLAGLQNLEELILSESKARASTARVSPAVCRVLGGKRFGLLGFTEAESERISHLLEQMEAFTRVLELSDIKVSNTLETLDVLIASAGGPDNESRASEDDLLLTRKPQLIVGDAEAMGATLLDARGTPREFILRPWSAEELFFRCYRLVSGVTQQTQASRQEEVAQSKRRVLLVDDDPVIISLLRVTLESYKIECHTADRGGLVLDMALRVRPHAIVLDINMPELDGFAVLTQLKQNDLTQSIPVVLLTAMRQEKDIIRGLALGADDYVVKPFNPMELAARLRRLLKASAAQ